jgi:uncharacterized Tic20 family protein
MASNQPIAKMIQAVLWLDVLKTQRELCRLIVMISYYRDMWIRPSNIVAPLTHLVSEKRQWEWTEAQQKAFETINKNISKEIIKLTLILLSRLRFILTQVHTQLGTVISQPIAISS